MLDENGQLVENAHVCTSVAKGNETHETCNVPTGESGQFQIEHLNLGSYIVSASKEQDGYSGYQQPEQKVTITSSEPDRNVTLRLSPRSGILVGSAKDKATGRPIVNTEVSCFYIGGRLNGSITGRGSGDGQFQLSVPPKTDLLVVVSAPGYKEWVYTDTANPSWPVLRLGSGEKKVLDVELERAPTDAMDK